jgi:putative NADPH-quinone reductase
MKVMVVLGHPSTESFNHAIAAAAVEALKANGHEVVFHDLYAESFDPILTQGEYAEAEVSDPKIKAQCDEVSSAGGYVIVHPNWWGQPPAIMKGWADRVLRYGVAYVFEQADGGETGKGLLTGDRRALVLNTCMTPEEEDRAHYGDPLENLWKNCIFAFCGIADFHRRYFRMVQAVSQDERIAMLGEVKATIDQLFPPGA